MRLKNDSHNSGRKQDGMITGYAIGRLKQDIITDEKWCEWITFSQRNSYQPTTWGATRQLFSRKIAMHLASCYDGFIVSEDGQYETVRPHFWRNTLKMYVSELTLYKMQGGGCYSIRKHAKTLKKTWALITYDSDHMIDGVIAQRDNLDVLIKRYGNFPIADREIEASPITTCTSVLVS